MMSVWTPRSKTHPSVVQDFYSHIHSYFCFITYAVMTILSVILHLLFYHFLLYLPFPKETLHTVT